MKSVDIYIAQLNRKLYAQLQDEYFTVAFCLKDSYLQSDKIELHKRLNYLSGELRQIDKKLNTYRHESKHQTSNHHQHIQVDEMGNARILRKLGDWHNAIRKIILHHKPVSDGNKY